MAEIERLIMSDQRRRYVLLDKDGVINRRRALGAGHAWDPPEFLPRSLEALHLLAANGYSGIVIARQSCEPGPPPTAAQLDAATRRFLLEVALSGGHIVRAYYCHHRKTETCNCYKPDVGLFARAKTDYGFRAGETYFVSERECDLAMAAAAGCSGIRIQRDAFLCPPVEGPFLVASNLYDAAEQIVAAAPFSQIHERLYAAMHA